MCRAIDPDAKTMGGVRHCCNLGHGITCLSLHQELIGHHHICWLQGNMSLKFIVIWLTYYVLNKKNYLLFIRWSGSGLSFTGTPHGDVIDYRMRLDYMTAEQVINKLLVT